MAQFKKILQNSSRAVHPEDYINEAQGGRYVRQRNLVRAQKVAYVALTRTGTTSVEANENVIQLFASNAAAGWAYEALGSRDLENAIAADTASIWLDTIYPEGGTQTIRDIILRRLG